MTLQEFNSLCPADKADVKQITKLHQSGKVLNASWKFMQLVNPGSRKMLDFINANHAVKQASINIP